MCQLLNVSYRAQVELEKFENGAAFETWEAKLNAEPGENPLPRTHVDPALLGMLSG